MKSIGEFTVKDVDLAARIGRLHTPHGVVETPALLPVIDPIRQELPVQDVIATGFNAVITNAYLLWQRRRGEAEEKGVHSILGVETTVMTDSGAYQLLRYGKVRVEPHEIIAFQQRIGSDIAVILDVPTGATRNREQAEYGVEETLRRAREALKLIDPDKRIWTLPIQGGPYIDLVEKSARESARLEGYQLYALGSPTVSLERYEYTTILEMVYTARRILPPSKPLHLFGAGHPMIIPFVVALGVDMFDSASYILYARDDRYMTLSRTYRLQDLDYLPCSCPVCTKYTPEELKQLPKPERTRMLAHHNLYVLRQALNEVKTAIREGRLWELLEERARAHPSLHTAFRNFRKYREYLEQYSPSVKGGEVHGIFLYSEESMWRPHVTRHHKRVKTRYKPRRTGHVILYPVSPEDKPATTSRTYKVLRRKHPGAHLVAYAPFIAVIPEELAETYPLSQHEYTQNPNNEVLEETARQIVDYIAAHGYSKVTLYYTSRLPWSQRLVELVAALARERNLNIEAPRRLEEDAGPVNE